MRTLTLNHSPWINLPDVALVEIFKYLRDIDRARAALVCENWSRIFDTPCLWRLRSFEMGGYRAQTNGERACRYAERFGKYLRYLNLSCTHPSTHTCRVFMKTIEELLKTLKDNCTQLHEFELCRLELFRYWKYDTPKDKLVAIFTRFFKSQKRLDFFDMSTAQFPAFGGCRLLETIGNNSGGTLQDLTIEDFFQPRIDMSLVKKFPKVLSKFTALKYLAINYNYISDEILELFTQNLRGKLEFLNIRVWRSDPHAHRLAPITWKLLVRACPRLRVSIWFESIGSNSEITPILLKEIPLRDVHIWTGYDDDSHWRLSDTITHIAENFKYSLDYVSLELDNTQEIVDEQILALVTQTRTLKEITINAMISIETAELICELLRTEKLHLKMLHITFCGIDGQQDVFHRLRDHYTEIFRTYPIDFRVYKFEY